MHPPVFEFHFHGLLAHGKTQPANSFTASTPRSSGRESAPSDFHASQSRLTSAATVEEFNNRWSPRKLFFIRERTCALSDGWEGSVCPPNPVGAAGCLLALVAGITTSGCPSNCRRCAARFRWEAAGAQAGYDSRMPARSKWSSRAIASVNPRIRMNSSETQSVRLNRRWDSARQRSAPRVCNARSTYSTSQHGRTTSRN